MAINDAAADSAPPPSRWRSHCSAERATRSSRGPARGGSTPRTPTSSPRGSPGGSARRASSTPVGGPAGAPPPPLGVPREAAVVDEPRGAGVADEEGGDDQLQLVGEVVG